MDSSDSESVSAREVQKRNDAGMNLKIENADAKDNKLASCGFCSACKITEDCSTNCENCVHNYIEKFISHTPNHIDKSCLRRICQTSEPKINHINDSLSAMELSEVKKEKIGRVETGIKMERDKTEVEKTQKSNIKIKQGEPEATNDNIKIELAKTVLEEMDNCEDQYVNDGKAGNNQLPVEMCGKCLGCTAADCGKCWSCIEKDVVATKELASKIICKAKICFNVKGNIKENAYNENKDGQSKKCETKRKRRPRCGSCPGCKVTKNCGICRNCIKKTSQRVCTARDCHVLKSEKSQRCGKCGGCQSLPCGDCVFCSGPKPQPHFCRSKRCQNPSWVKKKYKKAEINEDSETTKGGQRLTELHEHENTCLEEEPSLSRVNDWLNKNFEEETHDENDGVVKKTRKQDELDLKENSKLGSSKHIKRTKKCGQCNSCRRTEECGDCESCKINQQFGDDELILGKAPCLMYSCTFPVEVTGNLLAEQDESLVCPIKVFDGILYDYRCFYCKKLPRAGMANRSELLRHYSNFHFCKELQNEFSEFVEKRYCHLCDGPLGKSHAVSHFGQKHDEVMKYLPPEAYKLCPKKKIMLQAQRRSRPQIVYRNKTSKESDWPQVPEGYDASAPDRNWHGDSPVDVKIVETEYIIVDGWIIDFHVEEDYEPLPNESDPDYKGVGGVCNVCQTEFSEVTKAAMHLHKDHEMSGGSSYIMRDCQDLIKSGFIQLLPQQKQTNIGEVSVIKHTKEIAETEAANHTEHTEACSHVRGDTDFWEGVGLGPKVEEMEKEGLCESV